MVGGFVVETLTEQEVLRFLFAKLVEVEVFEESIVYDLWTYHTDIVEGVSSDKHIVVHEFKVDNSARRYQLVISFDERYVTLLNFKKL